ncbi:MAG: helix-turn-helix transcriptional regulator [Oscillospiraceae bacterium]|nr:helix-turn-helix transcriptional regulator [Oscillospiraceae bacterium]
MPFVKFNVKEHIESLRETDSEFKEIWDNSRMEYRILGELVRIRKEKGVSQIDLAEKTGNKQQVISRIENKENSPTLKTLCGILDVLGYDIQFVPKGID